MLDDDDFIVSDGDDDSEDDGVDDLITQLCEEHKVIQEQQANVSALRSAGIYRPTTPGYKARSTTTTPAQTPRLDERSVFVSSNPTLSQEWEDQIVPYSMPNTFRGTSAARTRTPHTPPHRVSISADNTPIGKIDTRVEYKPTENSENKTPLKTKTRKNNNYSNNMDSTPIKTPSKILPLSIPISPVPSFSSSSYSYSSKPSPVEHIHTNNNMKSHSYSPKHTDKRTFPSPPRVHHSKPPISPSHFHNSNISNHFNSNSNSNSNSNYDESEISPLPKSRSKKNLRVPMPFASSTSHELNNESLHTSLCKELDWYTPPPSPSRAKNRPTSAPSSRKISNVHASPPRVTVTSSPTSPRIPTSPYAVSPR